MKEWEAFRFPSRERSSLTEAARQQDLATGEETEEQGEQGAGEQGGEGQGALSLSVPETLPPPTVVAVEEVVSAKIETPAVPVSPPVAPEPELTPSVDTEILPEPVSAVSAPPAAAAVEVRPVAPPALPVPHKEVESTENSWTYDAARGILINWRIGKSLILNKMDQLSKVSKYIGEVEKNRIDRPGFEKALDQACRDIHGLSLERLLTTWDASKPLSWGITLAEEHLPVQRVRRRSNSH